MTTNPQTLRDLGAYWTAQGGVNLGVVGNAAHTSGYHLGKDRIFATGGQGWSDYSVKLARDKAGLTNAASAIDLGKLDGSLAKLWEFSRWFAQQCMDGKPGYRDVREVIFWSPSRGRVIGWSSLAPTQWINDYGDLSHKNHSHISWLRDSEARDKRPTFAPWFAPEGDTVGLTINLAVTHDTNPYDALGTAKVNAATSATKVADGSKVSVAAGLNLGVVQKGTMGPTPIVALNYAGELAVLPLSAVTFTPLTAPVTDCTAAVAAALSPVQAAADLATAMLADAPAKERERIALAEADRIRGI